MYTNQKNTKLRWLNFAVSGLLLTGFGLSLLGEAILLKFNEAAFWTWTTWGTAALVVFNAGLCLFGQAVIEKVKLQQKTSEQLSATPSNSNKQ